MIKYITDLNISFFKSGSGSTSTRISLPITILREMGISPNDRTVVLNYDSDLKILVISKKK